MLRYIIILLDDTSVSFCHYKNPCNKRKLIPLEILHRGIIYAMKENLNVQFVFPDYDLPEEYMTEINCVEHTKIIVNPIGGNDEEVLVVDDWWKKSITDFPKEKCAIIQTDLCCLLENKNLIKNVLSHVARLNIMLTGIKDFSEDDFHSYKLFLEDISDSLIGIIKSGRMPQLNLLTDRMFLGEMNNCGAGDTCITLAPNGCFYACPAFYFYSPDKNLGSIESGVSISNPQLYKLDHAPICRACDAFQCKRCIWLNQQTTMDINTPSHEQCVVAHLERNASRALQVRLKKEGVVLSEWKEIKEIDYLDPFNIVNRWK